ncbi:MAG: universal stress protein UspA [Flavobacteriaceae bacterium]|nr:universal stress protein UspA [Flavobacteriaceae bacterium]
MKKILVPIDFSEHSDYALEVASQLAKRYDISIVALHMMGLSEAVINKEESKEMMEAMFYMKLAEKRFNEFLDKEYLDGVSVETTVQNYKHFNEINSVAQEFKCDLIVMGSHGSSGLKEVFVGSNTEKVVRTSEIPVLVIKHKAKDFSLENVVFASNLDLEAVNVFKKAKNLLNVLGAKMKLVYVNTPGDGFRSTPEMHNRILQFLLEAKADEEYHIKDVDTYNAYNIEEGIFTYANEVKADAIFMPTHGRRGLAHFFSGSISEDLVNHSDLPVMTIKM